MAMRARLKRLEMALRASNPRALRLLMRLARSLQTQLPSQVLDDDLLRDCRFCSSREVMLELLPRNGVVAELGTDKGEFAREILKRNSPRELHLVDIDYSRFDETLRAEARVQCHPGLSDEIIATFKDDYFDWIYVDAGHSYGAVMADALASAPRVKPGGYLAFNDFAHIDPFLGRYGVHRAVIDFAMQMRWPIAFFAFQQYALYDVALRKPKAG
jgi:SAM-dependent methyltransferase